MNFARDLRFGQQAYLGVNAEEVSIEEANPKEVSLETEFQRIVSHQQIDQPAPRRKALSSHPLKSIWHQVGRALVDFLTGRQRLSIRQQSTTTGETQWIIYDPVTQARSSFFSEQAVRVWLEERSAR
ncbi:hypothetical protein S7335_2874 [Synechococcus sp. PCC 7335]|uniref:hypothetical protein n=1 Tax=Synechococcus sp. (strain ATCC 29403 / PCC 7335) TaxID=91464 RepID=UPI00017EE030|nr:hypothetical protein [Synechococcus sp. PCC 7335]EDX85175.1 hypothetical protein S7335_2874 [Synechococcus sp. PCC 7335]